MKIKVCGMTDIGQLQELEATGVDYAGLIFYPRSPRYAAEKLASREKAVRALKLKKTGVFVNADAAYIREQVDTFGLDAVQLHGDEPAAFCLEVQSFVPVVKALRIGPATDLTRLLDQYRSLTALLFDTDSAGYGGTGRKFDWSVLQHPDLDRPFFLSGGIGPEDAAALLNWEHRQFFAVDINSRFESAPGIKDMEAVRNFVHTLKS
ncbi:MAG TPA: phosphoribosylanthranilate isomerase [Chitinophagaceae bacterium]|jgi:phosphoribosylanthranilate isomerase|nr:phosphoribosylanthranilate isomerase [Chitinophagaceae bacterium]